MVAIEKLVVVGCSMGGLKALKQLFSQISHCPSLSFIVVQHLNEGSKALLPHIISQVTDMPCLHPEENDPIEAGKVYFARGGSHLILDNGRFRLGNGSRVNNARPSIDQLFLSAAIEFRERVIGVILTGMLRDGGQGIQFIRDYGGTTIIQDPDDAEYEEIPRNALRRHDPDFILPLAKIATVIDVLLGQVKVKAALASRKEDLEKLKFALRQKDPQLPLPEEYSQADSLMSVIQLLQEHCNMLENMTEDYLQRGNKAMATRSFRRLQEASAHITNLQTIFQQVSLMQAT